MLNAFVVAAPDQEALARAQDLTFGRRLTLSWIVCLTFDVFRARLADYLGIAVSVWKK